MKTIIAIGGGEIGKLGFPIETTEIDKVILESVNFQEKWFDSIILRK